MQNLRHKATFVVKSGWQQKNVSESPYHLDVLSNRVLQLSWVAKLHDLWLLYDHFCCSLSDSLSDSEMHFMQMTISCKTFLRSWCFLQLTNQGKVFPVGHSYISQLQLNIIYERFAAAANKNRPKSIFLRFRGKTRRQKYYETKSSNLLFCLCYALRRFTSWIMHFFDSGAFDWIHCGAQRKRKDRNDEKKRQRQCRAG